MEHTLTPVAAQALAALHAPYVEMTIPGMRFTHVEYITMSPSYGVWSTHYEDDFGNGAVVMEMNETPQGETGRTVAYKPGRHATIEERNAAVKTLQAVGLKRLH